MIGGVTSVIFRNDGLRRAEDVSGRSAPSDVRIVVVPVLELAVNHSTPANFDADPMSYESSGNNVPNVLIVHRNVDPPL